jgi:hypothetical protein
MSSFQFLNALICQKETLFLISFIHMYMHRLVYYDAGEVNQTFVYKLPVAETIYKMS